MSRLKLIHGVSRTRRTKLQSSIDQTVADDIELLAAWSNNETNYVINELLRFALAQEEDFQKYKITVTPNSAQLTNGAKTAPATIRNVSGPATRTGPTTPSTVAKG